MKKKMITALGVNSLNSKLKEINEIEVIGNDIPYQDGVLDILKGNSEINSLILHENLVGEYEIKDFINKIFEINKDIEISIFLESENLRLRNFLEKKRITNIFVDGEYGLEEIIRKISKISENNDIYNLEVEKLKDMISNNVKGKKIFKESKVVAISGNYGSGKSILTSLLGQAGRKSKMKTIIIDFDIINNSINTIFRVKKYNSYIENNYNIENFITHISNNLDVFCGIDALFSEKNKISYEKVENLISELKDIYDLILIDTSSETAMKFIKIVLANVDKIIFLVEPNLLQIKKAENLLEIYIEDWEVYPKKIEILFNKVDGNSIDENILKEIFGKFKIIGKIPQSNKFTEIANDIRSENFRLNKYMKILEKIS